ncbi:MAG: hypothetical protein OIN83_03650 [Candidatus Methanoperedens sp.]|nr:hypothetical protein [Candidatus Methanoperedens sp.]
MISTIQLLVYLSICLDHISEKCRNFEEDMRWALAEKAIDI